MSTMSPKPCQLNYEMYLPKISKYLPLEWRFQNCFCFLPPSFLFLSCVFRRKYRPNFQLNIYHYKLTNHYNSCCYWLLWGWCNRLFEVAIPVTLSIAERAPGGIHTSSIFKQRKIRTWKSSLKKEIYEYFVLKQLLQKYVNYISLK